MYDQTNRKKSQSAYRHVKQFRKHSKRRESCLVYYLITVLRKTKPVPIHIAEGNEEIHRHPDRAKFCIT